jgi:RNA polymerase sigma-70 factor (ECF subfamily)
MRALQSQVRRSRHLDNPPPDDDAVLADSARLALLVVLASLRPSGRPAFVLHDLFALPFDEIGRILGKSTNATIGFCTY